MKRTTLAITLALAMGTVAADGYVGLYGTLQETTVVGAETSRTTNPVVMVFGAKTNGNSAIGGEVIFANSGLGASLGFHQKLGAFTISLGKLAINDTSSGSTVYGEANSNDFATGNYLALQYDIFSIRLMEYNVSHSYTASKNFPHPTEQEKTITKVDTTSSSANRRQVWVGIQRNF